MNEHKSDVFNFTYRYSSLVNVGKKRLTNEDEAIELPEQSFFAISDGMGGMADGGDTSKMIKEHLLPLMMQNALLDLSEEVSTEHAERILEEKVQALNEIICDLGDDFDEGRFGATLTGVWLVGDSAVFVNIGDSRGYLLEGGELLQVTKDHNVAAHLVERGEITREEARNHPSNSRLLKYIGMPPPAIPDTFVRKVGPGSAILLCSDGMYGMLDDGGILEIISDGAADGDVKTGEAITGDTTGDTNGDVIVKRLIGAANENGGRDNISVIYISIV